MTKRKEKNIAPPEETPTAPLQEPPPPAPRPSTGPQEEATSSKAVPTSTASLVQEDSAKFPDPVSIGTPSSGESTPQAGERPPPEFPDKPPGYKGTGRPKGSKTRRPDGRFGGNGPSTGPEPSRVNLNADSSPEPVDYEALANLVVETGTQAMAMLIGPEWLPGRIKTPSGAEFDERLMITRPLAKYMEEKQLPDIPPGVLVLLGIAMYSSQRFRTPNTREKLGGFFKGVWGWATSFFRRRKKAPGVIRPETKEETPPGENGN